jgi:dipeptidase D
MRENPFMNRSPENLYRFLFDVFSIPRPSGKEEKIAGYLVEFARARGLDHYRDSMNNVLIRKQGSPGYESEPPVLIEGHTDMVAVKTPGSSHDFDTDPIDLIVEENWVRANGTTLGADNGCAVAIMLALLDDDSLAHPPLECLFAAQEEPGMLGMKGFDFDQIRARRGIGLDAGSKGYSGKE